MSIDFSKIISNKDQLKMITDELKKQLDEMQAKHTEMLDRVYQAVENEQIAYASKLQDISRITEELIKKSQVK